MAIERSAKPRKYSGSRPLAAGRRLDLLASPLLMAACLLAAPHVARGADDGATPSWVHLETGLSVGRDVLDARREALVQIPHMQFNYFLTDGTHLTPSWATDYAGISMLETSRVVVPGSDARTYVRPQFALGTSSLALRSWLRSAGIDAAKCTAPLMNLHSAFAGSNTHADVSISARCSVH
jgi:hypothetical protein